MKFSALHFALCFAPGFAPGFALASDPIAPDPWQIIHTAQTYGPATVGKDALGDPLIEARRAPVDYTVAFYGCRLGRDCTALLFELRIPPAPTDPDPATDAEPELPKARIAALDTRITEWNRSRLIGRAYRDTDGAIVLDHPVAMPVPLPASAVTATFDAWLRAADEFHEAFEIKE